ncbi:hypothetical protein LCGC14_0709910 [marine sediment metagenome]|uniref:Uncharacterized protein n=1 Tax=marine sediment metagenome TaxID=412755 RepID=A0A0F9T199_9ZZZZ
MRYTLHQQHDVQAEAMPDGTPNMARVDLHPPWQYGTQKALLEAFTREEKILGEGQYLIGFDNKTRTQLHFKYIATVAERWVHRVEDLEREVGYCEKEIRKWTARLLEQVDAPQADMTYGFGSSMDVIRRAASGTVCRGVLQYIAQFRKDGDTAEEMNEKIRVEALEQVVRATRSPSYSTSPVHNIIEQQTAAAWAVVLEKFQYPLDRQ